VPGDAGQRAGEHPAVFGYFIIHLLLAGVHIHLNNARRRVDFMAALGHVAVAVRVKGTVHRGVQAGGNHLGGVALGQQDIARVVLAWAGTVDLDIL